MGTLTLRSDFLSVTLDPDRGGEITSITAGDGTNALAYYDWTPPLAADVGPSYGSSELDWLSKYQAGWQFLFPNAGAESQFDGIPVAFHGEASLAGVVVEHLDAVSCTIRTSGRLPLELRRTVRVSATAPTVSVEETVTNVGKKPYPFLWGHHPTFPAIAGARLDLPASEFSVEPSAPGDLNLDGGTWPVSMQPDGSLVDLSEIPDKQMVRLLYLHGLKAGWAALRNPDASSDAAGVAMSWDLSAYPYLWLWLQNADAGFPWFGRARMIGIEPQRAWPFDGLARAVERGQAAAVEPQQSASSWLTLTVLSSGAARVTGVDRDGVVSHG
jgi:galactose mutarotase-like enzyme